MRKTKEVKLELDNKKTIVVIVKEIKIGRIYKVIRKLMNSKDEKGMSEEAKSEKAKDENKMMFSTLTKMFKDTIDVNDDDVEEMYGSHFVQIFDAFKEVNNDFLLRLDSLKRLVPTTLVASAQGLINQAFTESFLSR